VAPLRSVVLGPGLSKVSDVSEHVTKHLFGDVRPVNAGGTLHDDAFSFERVEWEVVSSGKRTDEEVERVRRFDEVGVDLVARRDRGIHEELSLLDRRSREGDARIDRCLPDRFGVRFGVEAVDLVVEDDDIGHWVPPAVPIVVLLYCALSVGSLDLAFIVVGRVMTVAFIERKPPVFDDCSWVFYQCFRS